MQFSNVGLVYRKELMETLRDRRTLISSILLPILLFPVLMVGFGALAFVLATKARKENPAVMILGGGNAPELARRIGKERSIEVVPEAADYVARINNKQLRAAVEFPEKLEEKIKGNPGESQVVKIYYFEGEFRSQDVARTLESIVRAYNDEVVKGHLEARKLPASLLEPFERARKNVASAEKVTGNILGMLLPYFIIILCLTGAMYPAIDLTAGEKERGTIETILASPASRTDIVSGKFLLVLTASLVTTALSILSFALTILGGATLIQRITAKLTLAISLKATAAVFFLILPLAILFSAALIAIALLARSYREAQTYLGPLMLIVILPAVASMMPGIELNTKLALIPILNVALVAKEILAGQYPWNFIGLIFGSTLVYAAAAIFIAVRQFHREEVLFRT